MQSIFYYDTHLGILGILATPDAVLKVFFGRRKMEVKEEETPLIKETFRQLDEYLKGKRKNFKLPFYLEGTPFQKKVYEKLLQIPYGETRTYAGIAQEIGNPKAFRAVGNANHHNPLWILVPCHRIIGKTGALTGYAGGLTVKEYLLNLERKYKNGID